VEEVDPHCLPARMHLLDIFLVLYRTVAPKLYCTVQYSMCGDVDHKPTPGELTIPWRYLAFVLVYEGYNASLKIRFP